MAIGVCCGSPSDAPECALEFQCPECDAPADADVLDVLEVTTLPPSEPRGAGD